MTEDAKTGNHPVIRETFEVADTDGDTVGVIADPHNEEAWIESDLVQGIVP